MLTEDYSLKQHNTEEYLRCKLDFHLNGESVSRRVVGRKD